MFAPIVGLARNLSPSPDWSGTKALVLASLVVGLIVAVVMILTDTALPGFRDTDDATRLVMVRQLLAGQGWYDQLIRRVDPPHGLWMHWSRLLDGGLASMIAFFRLFMPQPQAEYWTRFVWPLLWIFPGVVAAMALARNLGARSTGVIAALLLMTNIPLYRQFYPGRIDHHDVQIVMTVIALACATARAERVKWAYVAGAAAGFGLAVGLEALPMQALAGASYGLALVRDPKEAGPARAYGLTFAGVSAILFMVQTPPWRWTMSFCDVMSFNLVVALIVAGGGMAIVAVLSAKASTWVRFALMGAVGVAAAAAYLGIAPQCIHGPFAGVDPEVKRIWLNHVQEVQPLTKVFMTSRAAALGAITLSVMGLAAAVYLAAREWRRPSTAVLLILLSAILADVVGFFAWRMQDYVCWVGVPALAAADSLLARRWLRDLMLPTAIAALLLSPVAIAHAVEPAVSAILSVNAKPPHRAGRNSAANGQAKAVAPANGLAATNTAVPANAAASANLPAPLNAVQAAKMIQAARPRFSLLSLATNKMPRCFAQSTFAPLAALPQGNVLAIQDLGPFILVYTRDTTVAAPYHRVWPEILEVHQTLSSPPSVAESYARRLHADYIVDCAGYPSPSGVGSLGGDLRQGKVPPWLKPVSAPNATLRIYRVLPQAGTK